MKQETLEIANKQYNVRIYIERRRNSSCSIGKNINIRLPILSSRSTAEMKNETMGYQSDSKKSTN